MLLAWLFTCVVNIATFAVKALMLVVRFAVMPENSDSSPFELPWLITLPKEQEKPAFIPTDAERKQWLASAKPRLKRNKFGNDKPVKIGFWNPPEIEKTL